MTTFRCDENGDLWWEDWNWGHDDWARNRMECMADLFEAAKYQEERALGEECRLALDEFDIHWLEDDEQLRYETEMGS